MTYYVDPGTTKGCAVARSSGGALIGLAIMHGPRAVKVWGALAGQCAETHWEQPEFYPNELQESDRQTVIAKARALIKLAACGADTARALAGLHECIPHLPKEWKAQIPKPIHHGRVLLRLTPPELDLVRSAYSGKDLNKYVEAAAIRYGRTREVTGYSSEIVDLLDAVAFMLTIEGRL